ncbi:hypothetical protein ELQ92_01650 [Labedella populi]|uniref:Uncharacterized protein n=1 Tax=Labedella populi TaxID=2498850 RepID=A0A3S4A226_9MICO|nr:hypothetical protein [Labedella populi]RWZ67990.1 hypothetical protein ELQ92_01650 [Labedella populi]
MSTSEPFMPAHEPRADQDPRDREIDADVDADENEEAGVPDVDADTAAAHEPHGRSSVVRTPSPGDRLSPDTLEDAMSDRND